MRNLFICPCCEGERAAQTAVSNMVCIITVTIDSTTSLLYLESREVKSYLEHLELDGVFIYALPLLQRANAPLLERSEHRELHIRTRTGILMSSRERRIRCGKRAVDDWEDAVVSVVCEYRDQMVVWEEDAHECAV